MVYEEVYNKNYDGACEQLELDKDYIYTNRDEVLYSLDSGLLAHYSGNYEESNKKLSNAEKLMEVFYAKSISQGISSFFNNDNSQDYAGEEYEDIYSNVFMALNYIHLGRLEDAFVEIRRFDNKQKSLSIKYAEHIAYAKANVENLDVKVQFNNSAFARYLSLLLYKSINKMDSAEVDRKKIEEAFKTQPTLYPFEVPLAVTEEFSAPKDLARLNFVSFVGLAPVKYEECVESYSTDIVFKISLPEMEKRGTKVDSISVTIYGEDNNNYVEFLEKIESIENIAYDTFAEKQALIYSKSIIRAMAKSIISTSLDIMADKDDDMALLSFASKIWVAASEVADLRTSQFFPAEVFIGGVSLPEGNYGIQVRYLNSSGHVISEEIIKDVAVKKNKINLVESICVK